MYLISKLRFGASTDWKPFKRGIILSTMSCIELAQYLLEKRNYSFIFCGRFTQDCIENLFSVLRSKHSIMNALQFKNNLKLVTASYYMKQIASSNYEEDDRQHLPNFLQILQNLKKPDSSTAA